jgi:hypothetical protein
MASAGMMDDHVRRLAEDEQRVDRLLQLLATPADARPDSAHNLSDYRIGQSPLHSSSLPMEIAADPRLARSTAMMPDLSLSTSREQLRANLPTELTYFMPSHNHPEAQKRAIVEEAISGARGWPGSSTRTHDEARKRIVEEALSGARGVSLCVRCARVRAHVRACVYACALACFRALAGCGAGFGAASAGGFDHASLRPWFSCRGRYRRCTTTRHCSRRWEVQASTRSLERRGTGPHNRGCVCAGVCA